MRRSVQWLIVAITGMTATWLTWWLSDRYGARWLDLPADPGSRQVPAAGLAAAAAAIVVAWGTWWASRDRTRIVLDEQQHSIGERNGLGSDSSTTQVGVVPGPPPGFQPRDELAQALRLSVQPRTSGSVCALIGPRGVGKTQLAAAYIRESRLDWSVVAWVSGENPDGLRTGLAAIATELGLCATGEDSEIAAGRAKRWLENSQSFSLLVIDDADDPDIILAWLPSAGCVKTIITTTNAAFKNIGGISVVNVDVFSEFESVAFLDTQTGRHDDPDAYEIAAELGYLPLALAQAAWVIFSRGIPYRNYVRRLRRLSGNDLTPVPGGSYPKGAAEAILLSFAAAERDDKEGITRQLTDLLGLASPGGIQRHVLANAVAIDRGMPALQGNQIEAQVDDGLARLAIASIVTLTHGETVVTAHRLVRRVAQDRAYAEATLIPSIRTLAQALEADLVPPDQAWQQRARGAHLVEQVNALAEVARRLEPERDDTPDTTSMTRPEAETAFLEILPLRLWQVRYLCETAELTRAASAGQEVMSDCERTLGGNHRDTWLSRDLLAYVYERLGWTSNAIQLYEQSLADRKRHLGADHRDSLASQNNLACVYRTAGSSELARQLHEHNKAVRERLSGADSADTLLSLSNLACAEYSTGHLTAATLTFERVLAERQRVLGLDHPRTVLARSNLAEAYATAKQWPKAIPLLQQAVAERELLLGHEHPDTLLTRNNLGCAYLSAGRRKDALREIKSAARDSETSLGDTDPLSVAIRENLLNILSVKLPTRVTDGSVQRHIC